MFIIFSKKQNRPITLHDIDCKLPRAVAFYNNTTDADDDRRQIIADPNSQFSDIQPDLEVYHKSTL